MLIKIWDYFMRRKKLLLVVLAAFFLSGYGASALLQNINPQPEVTYIRIQKWGIPEEVEIPRTGDNFLNVLSPQMVAEMVWPKLAEVDDVPEEDIEPQDNNIIYDLPQQEPLHLEPEVISSGHDLTFAEICGETILMLLGIGVLILLGYLTYQHFMR